jgi:hypothetical protein
MIIGCGSNGKAVALKLIGILCYCDLSEMNVKQKVEVAKIFEGCDEEFD